MLSCPNIGKFSKIPVEKEGGLDSFVSQDFCCTVKSMKDGLEFLCVCVCVCVCVHAVSTVTLGDTLCSKQTIFIPVTFPTVLMTSVFLSYMIVPQRSFPFLIFYSSSPQHFGYQGPVLWKTIFLHTGVGEVVSGWLKYITFIVHFISIIIASAMP